MSQRLDEKFDEALEACRHAIENHQMYEPDSGYVCIAIESYAMIKRIVDRYGKKEDENLQMPE